MILLLSRDGFEADRLEDFKGLNRKQPVVRGDHDDADVQHRGRAAVPRLLGEARSDRRRARCRAGMARGGRGGFSVIGAFYYLRVIKLMYFDEPADDARDRGGRHDARRA